MDDHDPKLSALGPSPHAAQLPWSLPIELAELVLTSAIHRTAIASLWNPTSITQPLNALPRSAAPLLTKVALMHSPHVDLDTATKLNNVPLLRFMLAWSKQPGGRPVNYDRPVHVAMTSGSVEALDWWYDESGLCVKWDVECVDQACGEGHLPILQWWEARGFPHLDSVFDSYMGAATFSATVGRHMHIVEWIWARLANSKEDFAASIEGLDCLISVAVSDDVRVLEWWLDKWPLIFPQGMSQASILAQAFSGKHFNVLEWLLQHPDSEVVEHYSQQDAHSIYEHHDSNMVLLAAVRGGLLDWIDQLGVVPFPNEYWPASRAACSACDVQALEWLQQKKWLVGSRMQLMKLAANATVSGVGIKVKVMQWIHEHVRINVVEVLGNKFETDYGRLDLDLHMGACKDGDVQVLDWLDLNGYALFETKLEHYFELASNGEVLDWLVSNTMVSCEWLAEVVFWGCLEQATQNSYIFVLDWWKQKVIITVSVTDPKAALAYPRYPVEGLEWWLSRSGPLRALIRLDAFPFADLFKKDCLGAKSFHSPQDCVRILQLFWDARVPMDVAKCIHAASVGGNVEVLDWFLRVVKAPKAHFIDAFASLSHNRTNTRGHYENHADSLLWWWANIPQVSDPNFNARINRGPYKNPIHVHILQRMLKHIGFPWDDPVFLSRQGKVAMLKYLKEQDAAGHTSVLSNCDLDAALLAASEREGQLHVLEWWKTESGFQFSCPREIVYRQGYVVGHDAREWWIKSGMYGEIEFNPYT